MNRERVKGFVLGVVVALLAGMLAAPVLAETADVVFNAINIKVNGVKVASAGESLVRDNGTVVPYSIAYKGTTYLPLAVISDLLNADAAWESSTSSAVLTGRSADPSSQNPRVYSGVGCRTLTDVTGTPLKVYFTSDGFGMYVYDLTGGQQSNGVQYMVYLESEGYELFDSSEEGYTVTYMMSKELDVVFVIWDFLNMEVWISPVAGK